METWLIGGIVNIYVGTLFAIIGVRLTSKFLENRLIETFLLATFFNLTGFTGLIVGILELIYRIERTEFPIAINMLLDILVIIYMFVLLIFPIVLLEDLRFAVSYIIIILISIASGYILNDPLILRMAIIITVFFGVSFIMLYVYTLNKSIKALSFAIGLMILGVGIAIRPIEGLTNPSFILGIIGSTIVFLGQIIVPMRRTSGGQWVSRLKSKVEVR